MKKFSLLIPTRDRPNLFLQTIENLWTHTTHKNDIELLIICDDDDPSSQSYVKTTMTQFPLDHRLLIRPRTEYSNRDYYNWAGEQSLGELIWTFADDLQMLKFNWDVVIWDKYQEYKKNKPDNVICISVKDTTPPPSHRLPKFPCFPIFTRESMTFFGWLLHPQPRNWGVDYIAYLIYNDCNRLLELHEDCYINHISYHTHQVPADAISIRIGQIFNRTKMIPEHNTDRIISQDVPLLRKKLIDYINSFFDNKRMPPLGRI